MCEHGHKIFVAEKVVTRNPSTLHVVSICTACGRHWYAVCPLSGEEPTLSTPEVKEF